VLEHLHGVGVHQPDVGEVVVDDLGHRRGQAGAIDLDGQEVRTRMGLRRAHNSISGA